MAGPLLCLQGVSKQFLGIQVERAVCLACMGKRGKGKATAILASALNSVRLPLMPHPFWAIIASADFVFTVRLLDYYAVFEVLAVRHA
eukprot:1157721-Pelagomonas_calceolata.AAC.3